MKLKSLTNALLAPLCMAALPLFSASNTFIPQGPGPSFNTLLGPGGIDSGSPQPLAPHPTDPNTLFIGGCNGGIWRTNDFGGSWTPLSDNQKSLSIGVITFDPADPSSNTLVSGIAITGNGDLGNFALGLPAGAGGQRTGLLYTTDGGDSWSGDLTGNATLAGKSVPNVVTQGLNPNVSGTILAGCFEPRKPDESVGYGLFSSIDGGSSFNNISAEIGGVDRPCTTLATNVEDPNTIFAASSDTTVSKNGTALYRNTNNGQGAWTPVFTSADAGGLINGTQQTLIEAVTGPSGAVAVKLVNVDLDELVGVFLSSNDGASWTSLPIPPKPQLTPQGQAVVNTDIAIDPANPEIVYLTGTYIDTSPYPLSAYVLENATAPRLFTYGTEGTLSHADSRFLAFNADGRLLVGSDGGIDVRENPKGDGPWLNIGSNLSLWQSYNAAYDGNNNHILNAGQDTGITIQSLSGSPVFFGVPLAGDGVNAVCNDQGSTSVYYGSMQYLIPVGRLIVDGSEISFMTLNPPISPHFTSPIVLNRNDASKIAIGGLSNTYITEDDLTGTTLNLTDVGNTFLPYCISYGTSTNVDAMVVGTRDSGSKLYSKTTELGPLAPIAAYTGAIPASVVFDYRTEERFYTVDSTNLWGTADAGASFTNLTENLTALNIIQPTAVEFLSNNGVNALFAGGLNSQGDQSPLAVADSDDFGDLSGWRPFGKDTLPNTMINQVTYNNKADVLLTSAFGRGNWVMYDVTSNFPNATQLWFGRANNDSTPDLDVLTNGTSQNRELVKFGFGTLAISGPATYTGLTTVLGGAVLLYNEESRIPGDVDVKATGILKGIGSVGGLVTMEAGSILSPGNAIGTLTVGSLELQEGSTTSIEIDPVTSSKVVVEGSAVLAGQVSVVQDLTPNDYPPAQIYEIVRAGKDLVGSFDPVVAGGFPGFDFRLYQYANFVKLVYGTPFIDTNGLSGNNSKFARCLNTTAPNTLASILLASLSGPTLNDALTAASPVRNAIPTFVIDNTNFAYSDALDTHLTGVHLNHLLDKNFWECNYDCACQDMNTFWLDGFGDFAKLDEQDQTPEFRFNTEGFFVGYDRNLSSESLVGCAVGYSRSRYHEEHNLGKGDIQSVPVMVYGIDYWGDFYIDAAFTYSSNKIKNKRHIYFPDFDGTAKSSYHSNQYMPHLGLGYDFDTCSCMGVVEPFAEFDWVFNYEKGYKEHGSDLYDMRIKKANSSMLRSKVGVQIYQTWAVGCNCNSTFILNETLAYVNKSNHEVGKVKSSLVHCCEPSHGGYCSLETFKKDQNLFTFGVTGMFKGWNGFYGMFSYNGEFGSKYISNDIQLQVGKTF